MNEKEFRVRFLRASDLDTVARLERSIFPDPWSKDAFRRELEAVELSWTRVVEERGTGELVAYLVAWFVFDEVHLANVAVAPPWRGRGIAQRLLDELEEEGRRRGARLVTLEVRRSNDAARRLYRKNGFSTVEIRRRYYRNNREDALVMVKALNEAGFIPPLPGVDE